MISEQRISQIRQGYDGVKQDITEAAIRVGRNSDDIQLIVVTKAQPPEVLQVVVEIGARALGENYPEESLDKMKVLKFIGVEWHMIGHLQSRKARIVAEQFNYLESLDGMELAQKLERFLAEANRILPVLIECNVSGEETKSGITCVDFEKLDSLFGLIEQIETLPHLALKGLMTMPPYFPNAEQTRPYFRKLRQLLELVDKRFLNLNLRELSMGTSTDFQVAIEEGATMVRVGTAIVGPRLARSAF